MTSACRASAVVRVMRDTSSIGLRGVRCALVNRFTSQALPRSLEAWVTSRDPPLPPRTGPTHRRRPGHFRQQTVPNFRRPGGSGCARTADPARLVAHDRRPGAFGVARVPGCPSRPPARSAPAPARGPSWWWTSPEARHKRPVSSARATRRAGSAARAQPDAPGQQCARNQTRRVAVRRWRGGGPSMPPLRLRHSGRSQPGLRDPVGEPLLGRARRGSTRRGRRRRPRARCGARAREAR